MKSLPLALSALLLTCPSLVRAGCCEHQEPAEVVRNAARVGEYRVTGKTCLTDTNGRVVTRYEATLNAALKGQAPRELVFDAPGGRHDGIVEFSSLSMDLAVDEDCIFHLQQEADGTWSPMPFRTLKSKGGAAEKKALRDYIRDGARGRLPHQVGIDDAPGTVSHGEYSDVPGSVVTATGYTQNAAGHPARFTASDGAQPISYVVDVDPTRLPPGMDTAAALAAVEEALGVWADASSLSFRFEGTQSFGVAAGSISARDGRLRIQLHDAYNQLSNGALGVGGGQDTDIFPAAPATPVLFGGNVAGQGFQERLSGFLTLEDNDVFMDDIANFKHVLTHEIGHALGLAHSSNNNNEPNAILRNATMFWEASDDGRGAALTIYDEDRIAFGYPTGNTPPYLPNRTLRGVCRGNTSATLPVEAGVNRLTLRGFDRQGDALSAPTLLNASNAKFTLSGHQVVYAASDFLPYARLTDAQIESRSHLNGYAYVQIGDGTNLSRAALVSLIEVQSDSTPLDGLPNTWMSINFLSAPPGAVGDPQHPASDPDRDGLTNREEYFLSTDPKVASNGLVKPLYDHASRSLRFTPVRFAPYAVESSASLQGPWVLRGIGSRYGATGDLHFDVAGASVPQREFFRVVTGP